MICNTPATMKINAGGCAPPSSYPTMDVDPSGFSASLAYSPVNQTLWTNDFGTANIFVFNTVDNTLIQTIDASPYFGVDDILYDSINNQMVAICNDGTVVFYDPDTYAETVLAALVNSVRGRPICYDSTRGNILACDIGKHVSSTVSLIDGASKTVINSNVIGGDVASPVYCPATDKFYFSYEGNSDYKQMDPTTLAVSSSGLVFPGPVEWGYSARWMANVGQLWILTQQNTSFARMRVVNPVLGTFLGIASGPHAGAFVGTGDTVFNDCNNRVYASDFANVIQFETSTFTEVAFDAETDCGGLAFVHTANLMYVRLDTNIITL